MGGHGGDRVGDRVAKVGWREDFGVRSQRQHLGQHFAGVRRWNGQDGTVPIRMIGVAGGLIVGIKDGLGSGSSLKIASAIG